MVKTASTMMPLGTRAPEFNLSDVRTAEKITLESFDGDEALLVMFICRHCPFVIHVQHELARMGRDYKVAPLGIVAISANDAQNYPDDAPGKLVEMADSLGFEFSYCYDESQEVAQAYRAACTPDFFLFDQERNLVYRGQLDDSRPGNVQPVDGHDLRAAIDAVLAGRPIDEEQKSSIGCNIKWKVGNEPDYF